MVPWKQREAIHMDNLVCLDHSNAERYMEKNNVTLFGYLSWRNDNEYKVWRLQSHTFPTVKGGRPWCTINGLKSWETDIKLCTLQILLGLVVLGSKAFASNPYCDLWHHDSDLFELTSSATSKYNYLLAMTALYKENGHYAMLTLNVAIATWQKTTTTTNVDQNGEAIVQHTNWQLLNASHCVNNSNTP